MGKIYIWTTDKYIKGIGRGFPGEEVLLDPVIGEALLKHGYVKAAKTKPPAVDKQEPEPVESEE